MNTQIKVFCELIKNIIHPNKECPVQGEMEWAYLVQLAKEHNLLAIFVEGASKHYSFISRPEYEKEMNESIAIVSAQVRRTSAFLKLYEAFVKADLHPIVMKGLICRELYGTLGDHRPSGDEDILIRPREYEKAKNILTENGYISEIERESESQIERLQEVSFIHPKQRLHIELHLNPMGRETEDRARMSDYFVNVFEDYREVDIQGVPVRTMNHQDHLTFLILHAFKHFTLGGFGIRQMLDILLYQQRYREEIDFKQLDKTLCDFKASAFWNDMINIGNQYLGFELPAIHEPNCPDELLEDMVQCGAFGNKSQAEITAGRATMRASENYLKNKSSNMFIVVWRSIFPSKVYMLDQAPYLLKKPWLLPVAWFRRWGRFFKKSQGNDSNLAVESMKISRRRMNVLKKYDLV